MKNRYSIELGDICREVKKTSMNPKSDGFEKYIGLEHLDSGSLKINRWGDIGHEAISFSRVFKAGQILFGKRRPYLRKAAIADFDGVCSGDLIVLEPIGSELDSRLLPFILQSEGVWRTAVSTSTGSLSPRTKFSLLKKHKLLINREVDQRTIVNILEKSHRSYERYLELTEAVDRVLKNLYLEFFPNFYEPGSNQLSLPRDWTTLPLGELLLEKPQSGFSANEIAGNSRYHVLNLNNLSVNGYTSRGIKPITESDYDPKLQLSNGDLVISRANTHELVGLVGIVKSINEGVIFPDTMMRLHVNNNIISNEYLECYLLSPYGRRAIQRIAAGTSASMKKINKSNLMKIQIPVPKLTVQDRIVSILKNCRQLKSEREMNLSARSLLRSKIVEQIAQ